MSEREQVQNELVELIRELGYNAPYGILTSFKDLPRGGKARQISFGMRRTLDAVITIWTPRKFSVEAQGALARYFAKTYTCVETLKQALMDAIT